MSEVKTTTTMVKVETIYWESFFVSTKDVEDFHYPVKLLWTHFRYPFIIVIVWVARGDVGGPSWLVMPLVAPMSTLSLQQRWRAELGGCWLREMQLMLDFCLKR